MGAQACSVKKCCSVRTGENTPVTGTADYDVRPPGVTRTRSEVHMLICALDYKRTKHQLKCSRDGQHVEQMARSCGVRNLKCMYNEECVIGAVKAELRKACRACGPNDFFVFYFAGHGTRLSDSHGHDEAFCFMTQKGQVEASSLLTDDEFSEIVTEATSDEVNVLIIADCYHSGTVVDLQKSTWHDRAAVSLVGCTDQETADDIGVGGIFTHAMLMAMEKLTADQHCSIGKLYNTALKENNRVFQGAQVITLDCSACTGPNQLPWPFVPQGSYESPMRSAKNKAHAQSQAPPPASSGGNGFVTRDIDIGGQDVPDDLADWAKENDIDLGSDYSDESLENGWKAGQALLDKVGFKDTDPEETAAAAKRFEAMQAKNGKK